MGFCPIFVKWIMTCLSTVSYSFNLNGQKVGHIQPNRGIRQGDPLSPYLFIICAEGLSCLLHKAVIERELTGIKICRDSPSISHLFFADDSLLCCKASKLEARKVKSILERYGKASGQVVNFDKSAIFYSKNTTEKIKEEVCESLDNMREARNDTYLGLPMAIGRSKSQVFGFVKSKINNKLQGWKQKLLSQGGKEVLIKAVIMAMPTYVMACFRLPKGLCREISATIARFWWGKGDKGTCVHWASWKRLSEVKGKGGIGFRDLEAFNTALLAKQIWRFLTSPNLLVSKVMKAKYIKNPNWMEQSPSNTASWSWKSIYSAKTLLLTGLRKRIGDGKSVSIWRDKWISGSDQGQVSRSKPEDCQLQWVSELIEDEKWNTDLLQKWFCDKDVELIKDIPTSIGRRHDKLIWCFSKSGTYTAKTGYAIARQAEGKHCRKKGQDAESSWEIRKHTMWKKLWHLNVKAKLKHFMWKCLQNCLPTNEIMYKRLGKGDGRCSCCGEEVETIEHLFFFCENAAEERESKQESRATQSRSGQQARNEQLRDDVVCLYTDAAISAKTIRTGQGIIARNWKGIIMRAKGIVHQRKGTASIEEALAVRNALLMAKQAGWKKIIVHSDCKSAVEQINRCSEYEYSIATILEDVQDLRKGFNRCSFVFISRAANEISHALAHFAVKLVHNIEWENDFPIWLIELGMKEMRECDVVAEDYFFAYPDQVT
ncbi:uncharacterized protein LOC113758655 [Coffea eugenioides]|uniref:uncharacterized protein LOC113758655 n=1 Tax=Coffea eugenioides TaxID=49369 RepID=UPI000F610A92|nr:uncharacterized protein LOC113758655 [Coffea eugenioides]